LELAGICLAAPYFQLKDRRLLDKLKPLTAVIEKLSPFKELPMGNGNDKLHLKQLRQDPMHFGSKISPNNIKVNESALNRFKSEEIVSKVSHPTLILTCGKDNVVCNKEIQWFSENLN
jgi:alpha-beta hydrolase superfamily lysophospholipase